MNIFKKTAFIGIFVCTVGFVGAQNPQTLPSPKNIILMIGDGMGFNTIKATQYFGSLEMSFFNTFPVQLAVAHYPAKTGEYEKGNPSSLYFATGYNTIAAWKDTAYLKSNFTESAASATALATGKKTYNNSIGISVNGDTLTNLVQIAKKSGKSAGVVTSVPFSHATPAGFVAHNSTRINYAEIAYEMLLKSQCDVIMGCGNPAYDNNGEKLFFRWGNPKNVGDSAFFAQLLAGSGKSTSFFINGNLYTVADCNGNKTPDAWTVITQKKDFQKLMKGKTPQRVLGCAEVYSTLQQARKFSQGETKDSSPYITPFNSNVPTLSEMALGALNVLDNNKKGFFLMVEGGAIDWALHGNQKGRLIEETAGFFDAVQSVIQWVDKNSSWDETLLIVTADHETGLLWGEKPFAPLIDNGKKQLPGMTFYSSNHSNSLVPFFAKGIGSDWYPVISDEYDAIRGPYMQNSEIPQLLFMMWGK